jgi:transcriptional regulator GlxA family with amidase domain
MARITFVLYDQCMFSGVAGISDSFSIANKWHQYQNRKACSEACVCETLFDLEIVSPGGEAVMTEGAIQVLPHRAMEETERTDLIVIPPYMVGHRPVPREMPVILEWIESQYRNGALIAAGCTGVFVLAMTGLLNGRLATTNWQYVNSFRKKFPKVNLKPEMVLTEDSGLICSGAVTAIFNLTLRVIEIFGSEELARACAKTLLVDPSRKSQTPYLITAFRKNHGDREVLRAQEWMEDHFKENIGVDEAAVHAGLSPRHFKRRFKRATNENPLSYLQLIRLEAAKNKLETTLDNMEEITRQVGYEDSSTFRRLFKKYTSLSPREYRDKFRITHAR